MGRRVGVGDLRRAFASSLDAALLHGESPCSAVEPTHVTLPVPPAIVARGTPRGAMRV